MPSPPIEALRQRQEYILRTLQVKKIPFTSYDLASDEKAKRFPSKICELPPCVLNNNSPTSVITSEDAVEYGELDTFLRLKETWDVNIEGDAPAPAAPIGVPGAMMPLEMTPEHLKTKILAQQHSSPLKGKGPTPVNKRTDLFDVSTELSGFGLQGVHVSEAELRDLVAELGLDGDEAGDLRSSPSKSPNLLLLLPQRPSPRSRPPKPSLRPSQSQRSSQLKLLRWLKQRVRKLNLSHLRKRLPRRWPLANQKQPLRSRNPSQLRR
ncbi:hypothetical protein C8F04DRAFT_1075734 [Mycena alexandri]|uniref:Uncharacterized protein n=1 Tax=Mycena alexandri TaxID=1745969 RepID=A0AAD6TAE0_9AGAR|nr:hypothetical protein C8F04DRAFT_1075734 [Mycena alexandri]